MPYTGTSMALARPDTRAAVIALLLSTPSVTTINARRGDGRSSSAFAAMAIAS